MLRRQDNLRVEVKHDPGRVENYLDNEKEHGMSLSTITYLSQYPVMV